MNGNISNSKMSHVKSKYYVPVSQYFSYQTLQKESSKKMCLKGSRERLKCTPSWLILLAEFVLNLFMSFIIFYINASKFKKIFETLAFLD